MATPREWFDGLLPVTKAWLCAAVAATLTARFQLINPANLALFWEPVYDQFQIWRLVTHLTYFGRPSFAWLMTMFFIATLVPAYEADPYPSGGGSRLGNTADVVWMLTVCGGLLTAAGILLTYPFMAGSLLMSVVYIWSKRAREDQQVTFYMFRVPVRYLPWVMLAFNFVLGGDPVPDLLGIAAGHVYYFLQEVAPHADSPLKGMRLLRTPSWLYSLMRLPSTDEAVLHARMQGRAPAAQAAPAGRVYFTGQGRRLND